MSKQEYWLEAESFSELGGWIVDQQSMETLHSAYLMAHGMGVPVADAKTTLRVDTEGEYHVWVLTRDWTRAFGESIAPAGTFRVRINGQTLDGVLGTEGAAWGFQYAGSARLTAGENDVALHDLTGFNGRCDALYFTTDRAVPPSDLDAIDRMRERLCAASVEEDTHEYDLIVVGGGVAGICLALSAIRCGCDALLIHDRSVLGGCNSSEVRVCMGGVANNKPYENIGNVVKEIAPVMGNPRLFRAEYYEDHRKLFAFEASAAGHRVIFNECVTAAEAEGGRILSVTTTHTRTGGKKKYRARLFADCTGDAVVSRLVGARTMYGRESRDAFGESLAPETAERLVMGHSLRWYSEEGGAESAFPDVDWGLHFDDRTCLDVCNGDWEQEAGFSRDMIGEIEYIRDFGLRAIYSNWSYQKNHYVKKDAYKNRTLKWVSAIGGKRESYRVVGDHILTQRDVEEKVAYEDGTACMTWSIDLHFPECDNVAQFGEPFRSFAYHRGIESPYQVPYRCLYAADVSNLFLGGRIVSATHVAFSSIRVMRTLGQLGEVAGIAASLCKKHDCLPRDVYTDHLEELKEGMRRGVTIPSAFCCGVGREEAYHFKDAGWLHLDPYKCDDERYLEKFKRGIKALGIRHKYPLPEKLKDGSDKM